MATLPTTKLTPTADQVNALSGITIGGLTQDQKNAALTADPRYSTPTPTTTSTTPVAKPTTVVSSKPATTVAEKAKAVTANPPTPPAYDTTTGLLTSYGKSQGLPEVNAPKTSATAVPTPTQQAQSTKTQTSIPGQPTPEDQLLHEGQTQYYNTVTAQPEWIDNSKAVNGQPPQGYSLTNPKERSDVVSTADAQAGDGVVIKQFSDGTYGRFNTSTGDYTPATAGDFAAAQRVGTANTALDNLQKGILTPAQQTQIDSLKAQFQALIDKQTVYNANATGGTTIAQNLYGLGNTQVGQGAITQVINDGARAIADLQAKQQTAISDMMNAFETDDMNLLKTAYDLYSRSQTAIQSNIDKLQQTVQSQADKVANTIATQNRVNAIKYHVDIPDDATPQQARDILQSSPIYKYEQETKAGQADPDVTDAQVKYYKINGVIPTFSYGSLGHAERNAFWSAIGGNPSTIIDATTNKTALHAASTAQAKLETIKSGTEASIVALKSGIDIAEGEMNKLAKTGSPFLNKPLQWIQNQLQGNAQYSALNQAISTVASEYAKIKNGASASIAGAPVTSVEEEKKLINAAMSNGQLDATFDVIRKDSNARLLGFNAAINSIRNDITDLQSTDIQNSDGSTSGGSGGLYDF